MIKALAKNECIVCGLNTTPEGLACRLHWNMTEGVLKQEYQRIRRAIFEDIKYKLDKEQGIND